MEASSCKRILIGLVDCSSNVNYIINQYMLWEIICADDGTIPGQGLSLQLCDFALESCFVRRSFGLYTNNSILSYPTPRPDLLPNERNEAYSPTSYLSTPLSFQALEHISPTTRATRSRTIDAAPYPARRCLRRMEWLLHGTFNCQGWMFL